MKSGTSKDQWIIRMYVYMIMNLILSMNHKNIKTVNVLMYWFIPAKKEINSINLWYHMNLMLHKWGKKNIILMMMILDMKIQKQCS